MDFDYSKRGYLLPRGCKDLIDILPPADEPADLVITGATATKNSFLVIAQLPRMLNGDIEITFEHRKLRIVGRPIGQAAFETIVKVPRGYLIAETRAIYFDGELRIVVPKA